MHDIHFRRRRKKNIVVDADGFQQVKKRKNTKRNIFGISNAEARSNAYVQVEEIRSAMHRSQPKEGEASRSKGDQQANWNPGAQSEQGPDRSFAQDGRPDARTKGITGKDGGMDDLLEELGTSVAGTLATVRLASPIKGQGDPTSAMIWSPIKHAGHKGHWTERIVQSRRMRTQIQRRLKSAPKQTSEGRRQKTIEGLTLNHVS